MVFDAMFTLAYVAVISAFPLKQVREVNDSFQEEGANIFH